MHKHSIGNQVIGPDALRSPELHDFGDLREIFRTNRPLAIGLAVAVLLTIGHLAYNGHGAPPDASVTQQTASLDQFRPGLTQ